MVRPLNPYWRCIVPIFVLIIGWCGLYGQNLVKNPSFEEFVNCPKKLGNLEEDLVHWNIPTLGSTDYFHACSQAMGTPKNFNGEQPAEFGDGYVGLYLYAPDDYREYLQATLTKTLKKDEIYTLSFYVSLAERSDFAIKEFGILLSENPLKVATTKVLSRMHLSKVPGDVSNTFEIRYSDFYSDDAAWVKVEKKFVANGTENYLIIGNFKDNKRTQTFKTKRRATEGSYYYLDMISLVGSGSESKGGNRTVAGNSRHYSTNEVHRFNNLLFEFDSFDISDDAIAELMQIVSYLNSNPTVSISIMGHTDAIGTAAYNQFLSKKRASAVAQFLMQHGIAANRIDYDGFGSSRPIGTNNTSSGRHENRRVEFVFTKNN
ncbi:OmpA family protein [Maribacter flavus]|uniref:OmpA family protein n=1 Tax=Maribacter flavus TaxID=1658664 RepID=UPI001FE946F1|nr:OmpA family protein [Maribacter flavus]